MNSPITRVLLLVLDSVGIGALPDAADYGDQGADTLGNIARHGGGLSALKTLGDLGLGAIAPLEGLPPVSNPKGAHGKMRERSAGKDTTTGHWELAGLITAVPFATFPQGFPEELLQRFTHATGFGYLGNVAASGTEIIDRLGEEHLCTGKPIVYTSADSVFQIAAHEEIIPLPRLYEICSRSRAFLDQYRVARVIARPFIGRPGTFTRTTNRKDFSMKPGGKTVLDLLVEHGHPTCGVGKIANIFADQGIVASHHTKGNADGMATTRRILLEDRVSSLIFVNLIDFDMLYGHRNDLPGYRAALIEFDRLLQELLTALRPEDLLLITADHGCDPTFPGTDHTREYVPILAYSGHQAFQAVELGIRNSFADVGKTVADCFGLAAALPTGTSFLGQLFP